MKIAVITGASWAWAGVRQGHRRGGDARRDLAHRPPPRAAGGAGKKLRTAACPWTLGDRPPAKYKRAEGAALISHTLCNVAGFGRFALFTETPLDVNLSMIDINDKALVAMTQLSLPYMKRGSRVINLDSLSAFQPVPYQCIYGSTKAFVLSFSRALNVELEPRGIRVMAVSPGWVKTEFFEHAVSDNGAVTYYDILWEPADVVKQALKDYKKGKDLSILGHSVRRQVLLVKLLPHRLIMKIWMKQQGHAHRPPED
ncbi:MAG: SDR family NAD(P)-dependent oxidoreductase [Oscillospiraceae bacterium]